MEKSSSKSSSKPIYICSHCGDRFLSNIGELCSKCKTKEKREAMDAENREIWKAQGKEFHCHYCERLKIIEESKNI